MSQGWRRSPLPNDWPRRRARILKRDERCRLALPGCTIVSTEVDHIDQHDDHTDANLRGVCSSCHHQHTEQQRQDAIAKRSRKRPTKPHPGLKGVGG